jgi:hypothetical protein
LRKELIFVVSLVLAILAPSFCGASLHEDEEAATPRATISPVQALEEMVEQGSGVATLVLFYDRVEKEAVSSSFLRIQGFFESLAHSSHDHWKERAAAYLGLGLMCHKGHYVSSGDRLESAEAKRRADLKLAWHYAKKAQRSFRASPGTQKSAKSLMAALLCEEALEFDTPVTDLNRYHALGRLKSALFENESLYETVRKERARLARRVALGGPQAETLLGYEQILRTKTYGHRFRKNVRLARRSLLQKAVHEDKTCARTRVYLEVLS